MIKNYFLISLILCCVYSIAYAETTPQAHEIGIGGLFRTEPYIGIKNTFIPFPHLDIEYKNIYVNDTELGYSIVDNPEGDINLVLRPRFLGFRANDSQFLQGMKNRYFSIDAGITATRQLGNLKLEVAALSDALNKHHGQELSAFIGTSFSTDDKTVTFLPSLGVKWQSSRLVDYYYGVAAAEARPNRPIYQGKATVNYVAMLNTIYALTPQHNIFISLEYERFGKHIANSPIVENNQMITVFFGYGWKF